MGDTILEDDGTATVQPSERERREVSAEDLQQMVERAERARASESSRRQAAEARAAQAAAEVAQLRGAATNQTSARYRAEHEAFESTIASVTTEEEALVGQYTAALQAGDFAEAGVLQRKIARAAARLESLGVRRDMLAREREQYEAQSQQPQAKAPVMDGEVDLSRYSPGEQHWIKAHPEYLTDERLRLKLAGAHNDALGDGIVADSPEYWEKLDAVYGRHTGQSEAADATPAPKRAASPAVMPVSRAAAGGRESPNAPIKLTPEEREAADITMPDLPVNDYTTADGTKMPGRYRAYHTMQSRMRADGRLN